MLIRGHWSYAFVWIVLSVIFVNISSENPDFMLLVGIVWVVLAFKYNRAYVKYLIKRGYKAKTSSQDIAFFSEKLQLVIPEE